MNANQAAELLAAHDISEIQRILNEINKSIEKNCKEKGLTTICYPDIPFIPKVYEREVVNYYLENGFAVTEKANNAIIKFGQVIPVFSMRLTWIRKRYNLSSFTKPPFKGN